MNIALKILLSGLAVCFPLWAILACYWKMCRELDEDTPTVLDWVLAILTIILVILIGILWVYGTLKFLAWIWSF